jgi:hypothetical protein
LAKHHQNATENYMRAEVDTTKVSTSWQVVKSEDGTEDHWTHRFLFGRNDGYVRHTELVVVENASKNEAKKEMNIFKNAVSIEPQKEKTSPAQIIKFSKPAFQPKKEATETGKDVIQFANVVFNPKKEVIKFGKTVG